MEKCKVKSSNERWDHWWCQLFCFNLMSPGLFLRKECIPGGAIIQTALKSTWFLNHFFFYSWIEFLVSMVAVYPQRRWWGAKTQHYSPVLWSAVMSATLFPNFLRYSPNDTSNTHKLKLMDCFISAPFSSFSRSILLIYHLESQVWIVEWEQWNCWWFMQPHNVKMMTAVIVTSGIYNTFLWSHV